MPARLITPPALEPVTLAEAKAHLRLETALDDDYVNTLIAAARHRTEQECWRGLVTQTWELALEGFIGEDTLELGSRNSGGVGCLDYIELPKGNLIAVASVKYIDVNGTEQTLASTEYTVDAVEVPGRIRLAYDKWWPQTRWPRWDAVRIQYSVGWPVTTGVWTGPTPLKQALLLLISQLYENRSATADAPTAFDALTSPYRLNRL